MSRARCPLCHQSLAGQKIEIVEPESRFYCEVDWGDDTMSKVISAYDDWAQKRGEIADDPTLRSWAEGLFVRHCGCQSPNPYWDEHENRVDVPGGDDPDSPTMQTDLGRIRSWQVIPMRQLASFRSQVRENWFPFSLLRSIWEREGGAEETNVRVLLLGPQGVGKTVLAVQSLLENAYSDTERGIQRGLQIETYVSSQHRTAFEQLLHVLEQAGRLSSGRPLPPPLPTPTGLADLKAVAFRRQNGTHAGAKRQKKEWWSGLNPFAASSRAELSDWPTLVLYDFAGEAVDEGNRKVERAMKEVDVALIFVDALQLFGGRVIEDNNSLYTAVQQLRLARKMKNLRPALVVTKLDEAQNDPDCNTDSVTWSEIVRRVETVSGHVGEFGEFGEACVRQWLQQTSVSHSKPLLALIDEFRAGQCPLPVYLVWTERLNAAPVPIVNARNETRGHEIMPPTTFGLARLVSWCLQLQPTEIFSGGIAVSGNNQPRGERGRISIPDMPAKESLTRL